MFDVPNTVPTALGHMPLALVESKPSISVVGLGYVGAVSTACLSKLGHQVIGVDIDQQKVNLIESGQSPIHEKDLGNFLFSGVSDGLVTATTDLTQAVVDTDITFVSVGTPTAPDGGCNQSYIEAAATAIGEGLKQKSEFHIVVLRCSVPPGLTMNVMRPIIEQVSGLVAGTDFGIAFNPEFLREGVAVEDFFAPPKTVIGATDQRTAQTISRIFEAVDPNPIVTSIEAAEAIKYADNVWHATKVCFANEIGRFCKALQIDSHEVMDVFVQDQKLNLSAYYLKPGFAYGGSCLPKEVRAIKHIAKINGLDLPLVSSLEKSNDAQIEAATNLVLETGAKRVAVLGLAFKAGTDDLRESPILKVVAALRKKGVEVTAFDQAAQASLKQLPKGVVFCHGMDDPQSLADDLPSMMAPTVKDALSGAEAVIVTHKTDEFRDALLQAPNLPVIDVVRLFKAAPEITQYQGICW